jgi:hypothetical protein
MDPCRQVADISWNSGAATTATKVVELYSQYRDLVEAGLAKKGEMWLAGGRDGSVLTQDETLGPAAEDLVLLNVLGQGSISGKRTTLHPSLPPFPGDRGQELA